ncbi:MAG: hypothetical protein A2163_00775 [Actinobacteria bacterium RBG_13_35_12]|nr:MAG: hypothetical protein A2163_00775 [Actinobacteria bacterium RBG_13_35_12]
MGGIKTPKAERQRRVLFVIDMILKGYDSHSVWRHISESKDPKLMWGISERTFYHYLKDAHKFYEKVAKVKCEREVGKAIKRYEHLFTKAYYANDFKTCIASQKALCDLLGIEAPAKVDHSGEIEVGGFQFNIIKASDKEKTIDKNEGN